MTKLNPQVDAYLAAENRWRDELAELRSIALDAGLAEEFKWKSPCYTHQGRNVAILGGFNDNCVLSFFKGALLSDPAGILQKPGANTQAARVVRLTSLAQIVKLRATLARYLREAIAIEQAGTKVDPAATPEFALPAELAAMFEVVPGLQTAFESLTPGRQRGYALHFAGAKQSRTRTARIEKCVPKILAGKGMHDCICGLSQRMPACDGSHQRLANVE